MPKKKEEKLEEKPKIRIKLKAYDSKLLDSVVKQIIDVMSKYDVKIVGPIPLPTEIKRYTVLRATFVHKDSREQFEQRIHKRLIDIIGISPSILETLKSINIPAGVEIQIKV